MSTSQPYIPYMGNKFKIVNNIYDVLRQNFHFENVVSLFCGGGSLEYFLAQRGFNVLANDLDSGLIELHNHLVHGGALPDDFITREMFMEMRELQNWLGAYVRQVWSFSNNQSSYLYSKERVQGPEELLVEHRLRKRHLEDIRSLKDANLSLRFISNDYRDVDLSAFRPDNTIIYCDPPYKGTRGYNVGEFDNEAFYKWALANDFTVVISEYDMPAEFNCIAQFPKVQGSAGAKHQKTVLEGLYTNKPVKIGLGI